LRPIRTGAKANKGATNASSRKAIIPSEANKKLMRLAPAKTTCFRTVAETTVLRE
jgi:hypothetical protein